MARLASSMLVGALGASLLYCHTARPPAPALTPQAPAVVVEPPVALAPDAGAPVDEEERARWAPIDLAVQAALDAGKMPGCVIAVGRHDEVLFERAYGARALLPERVPMTTETVFDLASLTKPVATATSVMLLVERGKIDLDARASAYVPELARLPPFTVRQLLIHTSGLPADTALSEWSADRGDVIRRIGALTLKHAPGTFFAYSDVGFVVLQEIVERVAGKGLSAFASDEIFAPLGMRETGFLPPPSLRVRAAPTEQRDGGFMLGEVHDPRAFALGGVAGHAGAFSTAHDLGRFARAFLEHGQLDGTRVFSDATFARLSARHDTPKGGRALGWDIDSTYATHRGSLLSPRAFGHGGFTGTAMWIDPERDLFVVFLSNRVHPDGKGAVNPTIGEIVTHAADAVDVKTGIDVLRAESFERLRGARVGLVTNASAKAKDGSTTIDLFKGASGLTLATIFTPEHGIGGDKEGRIADSSYGGVPVRSLYGVRSAPSSDSLDAIDTLVVDLQDVGLRYYTYAATMKRAMKVAAERHLRFVVLDRPNPIGGAEVAGPVLADDDVSGFVNHHALPLRHGLTMGELAKLFAEDDGLELAPEIVRVVHWRRKDTFERTGLAWSPPSPNLKSLRAVELYPAIGLLESTNVSVGRGTDVPFEIVAAPWLDSAAVIAVLAKLSVAGAAFEPIEVTPKSSVHAKKKCRGVRISITDRARFEPIRAALAIAAALHEVHPKEWEFEALDKMLRSKPALEALRAGTDPAVIEAVWATELDAFKRRRERVLIYR